MPQPHRPGLTVVVRAGVPDADAGGGPADAHRDSYLPQDGLMRRSSLPTHHVDDRIGRKMLVQVGGDYNNLPLILGTAPEATR